MSGKPLSHAVMSGLSWTSLSTVMVGVMQLVMLVVLSRLLSPQEIGLFALVTLFSTIVEKVGHLGIAPALVQKLSVEASDRQIANTIAVILGLVAAVLLYVCRDQVAGFIGVVQLAELLPVASLIILLDSMLSTSESMMQREMLFRQLALSELSSYAIGYVFVGLMLALLGYGVWSLLIAAIAVRLVKCAVVWQVFPPDFTFNIFTRQTAELLKLGFGFTTGRIFNYLALQGDNFVVGKMLGAAPLGLYSRAYQLISLPADFLGKAFDKVWFPAISRKQTDPLKLRTLYIASVELVALVCIPCALVMIVFCDQIISLLLGAQWQEAIPVVQVLAPGIIFRAGYKPSDTLARSMGAVYPLARRQMVYAIAVVAGVSAGAYLDGLVGAAFGVLVALTLQYLVASQLAWNLLKFHVPDFCRAHLSGIWVGVGLVLLMSGIDYLVVQAGAGSRVAVYLKLILGLPLALLMVASVPGSFRPRHAVSLLNSFAAQSRLPVSVKSAFARYARS